MRASRRLNLLTLVAFLPSVTGCYDRSIAKINSDAEVVQELLPPGEEVRVEGYTLSNGVHMKWEGHVRVAPPDSLEFVPHEKDVNRKGATFGGNTGQPDPGPTIFRLAQTNVRSLDVSELDGAKALAIGLPLALLSMIALAAIGLAASGDVGPTW